MNKEKTIFEHAFDEMNLINAADNAAGKCVLNFVKELSDITNDGSEIMVIYGEMLKRIFGRKILSPITEKDFNIELYDNGIEKVEIARCTRIPSVIKSFDGKYYNEKGIVYINIKNPTHKMYIYEGILNSRVEITLPYDGEEKVIYLDDNENIIS